jgi:hypothetical protein
MPCVLLFCLLGIQVSRKRNTFAATLSTLPPALMPLRWNEIKTRAKYPGSNLADLYDPVTMPPDLVSAHQALHKAVDLC